MSILNITYGLGGLCDPCDNSHDHPFNNIIETVVGTPPYDLIEKESINNKLLSLGLTVQEIDILLGNR